VFAVILDIASRAGESPTIGGAPATVLVSVREQDLNANFGQGRGVGWIDGIEAPISISAVTDLIENGGQQKVVINEEGRIIALGSPERCFTAASGWAIRVLRGAVQIMAPPWLETGTRKWRNVTTARTRMTDAIERKNVTRDDD
jgi:hypothetical protein